MANKKINQLVSKTSILSTDLFGIGDATTGQLFKKTIAELQAAIGGAVISVNGLVGTVVLDTDDIQELATPTNKYFTDARARGAISLTVTGNSGASTYSSGTGVLNVPTYTLAGLGGITASFLSGASGISYNSTTGVITYSGTVYTDASIRALFSGGTGITYNSSTGAISYSGTVYTDSSVRALISLTTTGTSGASTYNNTTGVINVPEYTLAGLGGITASFLSGGTGITYNSSTGAISYSGTVYTDASIRALFSASGAVSYNNTTGVISLTGGNLTEATSSVLTITGGSGAVIGGGTSIQVKQATTSVSGFLSSTDWNTFNGKANALSGTTNYVSKFTSSTAIGNSTLQEVSGNLSLGVTPSAWVDFKVLEFANGIYLGTYTGGGQTMYLGANNYFNGTDYIYKTSAYATRYQQASGAHQWFVSTISGTAGNAITFTQAMTLTAAGNLGVNTSSPNTSYGATIQNPTLYSSNALRLERGGVSTQGLNIVAGGENVTFNAFNTASDGLNSSFVWTSTAYNTTIERMRINSAGRVIIGGTTAGTSLNDSLTVNSASAGNYSGLICMTADTSRGYYGGTSNGLEIGVSGSGYLQILTSGIDRVRVTSGGNILMGTTSDNGERLYVSGAIRATSTITANSDLTLKKNLLKIENALEKVEQINGYTYELKADDSKRHAGVIAQEIQTVLPEIVNKGNDGILGVEYGNISALLIEAIKEQNIKIKNLETLLASK